MIEYENSYVYRLIFFFFVKWKTTSILNFFMFLLTLLSAVGIHARPEFRAYSFPSRIWPNISHFIIQPSPGKRIGKRIYKKMMTSSNGNIFRVTGPLCGNSPVTGEFPSRRPMTRSFDVFSDPRLNKRLSKQSWGWWFETPSLSLWRCCNEVVILSSLPNKLYLYIMTGSVLASVADVYIGLFRMVVYHVSFIYVV